MEDAAARDAMVGDAVGGVPSPDPNWTQWERGLDQLQKWEHQLKMETAMGQEQGIPKVN